MDRAISSKTKNTLNPFDPPNEAQSSNTMNRELWKKKGKILDAFRYPFLFYRRLSRPNQFSRERIIITFPIGCFAKGVDQFESRLSSRAADITSDANGESLQSRFAPP